MPSTCVVGLQWGDEAKGKIVDWLCDRHDVVVRYQGGANAGHTVVADGVTYKLSLVPTGLLRPGIDCVIGNGVVIHPPALLKEVETLTAQGVEAEGRLLISDRAHVILPYHLEEERLTEESVSAADHLGTTRRGIGPCYRDKVGRVHGVRVGDLYHPEQVRRAPRAGSSPTRTGCSRRCSPTSRRSTPATSPATTSATPSGSAPTSATRRPGSTRRSAEGKRLLFEGAQGSLLDVDHGTYPYVTSSNSSAAGIAAGSGVPTRHIDRWLGIVKAYTTRVGGGPFPTEQDNEIGERIRRVGREYGTVTGRPRRCGWFDAVAVRHSARVSGSTEVAVMLLDVLSGLETLQVAVAYEDEQGRRVEDFPGHLADLERCRPVYETLPGWPEDITGARTWDDLPGGRPALRRLPRRAGRRADLDRLGRPRPDARPSPGRPRDGHRRGVPEDHRRVIERRARWNRDEAETPGAADARPDPGDRPRGAGPAGRRWGSGPSSCPGTSPSSWTATADGPRTAASPGSSATARGSGASGRSSRKAAGSASTSSRSIASRSRTGSGPLAS